ncbi:MAG: multidrug effflux MFS transporter [Planktomarina sp.]
MTENSKPSPNAEFIIMIAFMISMVALSIDIILPAMGQIGTDLPVANANDVQLVITLLFLGFAVGQIFVGPLSDSYGRKPTILGAFLVFFLGCGFAIWSPSFEVLLIGRVLQGIGLAGPRIVSNAIVRDLYVGRGMAKVMSVIMMLFILVPMVAPALGQLVMNILHWRAIFVLLLLAGGCAALWYGLRQGETLAPENRRDFNLATIWMGIKSVFSNRVALGYTISMGFIFGPFLGYLSVAQKLFHETYAVGNMFAFYFAMAAFSIGLASLVNSRLVERFGMAYLSIRALIYVTCLSAIGVTVTFIYDGIPPFWMFMVWLNLVFFAIGIIFGNLNALAMEPLGHIAGLGAAVVGSISTLMSLPVAWLIGDGFDGTLIPMMLGFCFAAVGSFSAFMWATRARSSDE